MSDRRPTPPTEPIRTCIGCRSRDVRSALLRVALGGGENGQRVLLPDRAGRLPGRGAWLHPSIGCFEKAVRRRAFGRALRCSEPLDDRAVADWINRELE